MPLARKYQARGKMLGFLGLGLKKHLEHDAEEGVVVDVMHHGEVRGVLGSTLSLVVLRDLGLERGLREI